MKTRLLAMMLLAGSSVFAAHLSIGVGVGVPGYYAPAPPPVVYVRPPYPGPGYAWVNGYWAPSGVWVGGYWAPPYRGPYWVAPRYYDPGPRWHRDRDWDRHDRGHGYGYRR